MIRFIRLLMPLMMGLMAATALAQAPRSEGNGRRPTEAERKQWMAEMTQYKHDFMSRELQLTDEQKEEFFKAYDAMDRERWTLEHEARRAERQVLKKGASATEQEMEQATDAAFALEGKQHQVTMKYLPRFKAVLTKVQMFNLKRVERDFQRSLMEHRRDQQKPRR